MNEAIIMDMTQLNALSKPELQNKIITLKADYHPSETKRDLIGRIMQLQGTAQPIDTLRKAMAENGLGAEDGDPEPQVRASKQQTKRLTKDEIVKIARPYAERGLKVKMQNDGQNVELRLTHEQIMANNKIKMARRVESINTMIPLSQFKSTVENFMRIPVYKRAADMMDNDDGNLLAADEMSAAEDDE